MTRILAQLRQIRIAWLAQATQVWREAICPDCGEWFLAQGTLPVARCTDCESKAFDRFLANREQVYR